MAMRKGIESTLQELKASDNKFKLEEIREIKECFVNRYLKNPSYSSSAKRTTRWNDKKLIFDWHPEDDTSKDYNLSSGYTLPLNRRIAGDTSYLEKQSKVEKAQDTRHWSKKPLSEMQERDWRIMKEDFCITTKGGKLPPPIRAWSECPLSTELISILRKLKYEEPTPIQRQAIPIAMANRDLIGLAETGSGKTLAFLLPILTFILGQLRLTEDNAVDGPYALVLAPTRELVLQIEEQVVKFTVPLGIKCVSILGGHSIAEQAFALRNGSEIIVATPGRLLDALDQRILTLNRCSHVVLDEADRMMDLGFEPELTGILESLPQPVHTYGGGFDPTGRFDGHLVPVDKSDGGDECFTNAREEYGNSQSMKEDFHRQTTMFSATMLPSVERLAKKYLNRPAMAIIGTTGLAVESVELRVEMIPEERKRSRLLEILSSHQERNDDPRLFSTRNIERLNFPQKTNYDDLHMERRGMKNAINEPIGHRHYVHQQEYDRHDRDASVELPPGPILIFVNHKKTVDMLVKHLDRSGFRSIALHGGKSQESRETALESIKQRRKEILVATDVASRGLDIKNVALVINYDMAKSIEDFIHRIGRTGRAGNTGISITFLTPEDTDLYYDLKQLIMKSPRSRCPMELLRHEAAQTRPGTIRSKRKSEETIYAHSRSA